MPLLADSTSVYTVAMALLATLGAGVSSYLNYRAGRDKLAFDAKVVGMEAELRSLREKTDDCDAERDKLVAEVGRQAILCQTQQYEINELRRRLDEQSRTHKPIA